MGTKLRYFKNHENCPLASLGKSRPPSWESPKSSWGAKHRCCLGLLTLQVFPDCLAHTWNGETGKCCCLGLAKADLPLMDKGKLVTTSPMPENHVSGFRPLKTKPLWGYKVTRRKWGKISVLRIWYPSHCHSHAWLGVIGNPKQTKWNHVIVFFTWIDKRRLEHGLFLGRGPQSLEDRVGRTLPFDATSVLHPAWIGQGPGRTELALSH